MSTASPTKAHLSSLPKIRGESRTVLLHHDEAQAAARLVRVETGGVDRQTGAPASAFYEVTVKLHRQPEVTRTFAHERNARLAYLMAQHGATDFTTALADLGPRLWPEPKNLAALDRLPRWDPPVSPVWTRPPHRSCPLDCWCRPEPLQVAPGTRINSGDSDADSLLAPTPAPATRPGRESLFREVPVADLVAEEASVFEAARPIPSTSSQQSN